MAVCVVDYRGRVFGVTAIELLVALGLVACTVFMACYGGSQLWNRAAVRAATAELQSDLSFARYFAISRARYAVSLCPSIDGQRCAPAAAWHDGWIIFVDSNRNGQREIEVGAEGSEMLLRARGRFADVSVTASRGVDRAVTFRSNAQSYHANGAFLAGSWVVCPRGSGQGRRIVMNAVGRVRVEDAQPSACRQ